LAISGQPLFASVPFTAGQRSSLSETPSPSVSGQPLKTSRPAFAGQASSSSTRPSLSVSMAQPVASTLYPAFVFAHLSSISATPSLSVSGQPFNSESPATSGQRSFLSAMPSPSVSGQPLKGL
jgi:hypothetical protein